MKKRRLRASSTDRTNNSYNQRKQPLSFFAFFATHLWLLESVLHSIDLCGGISLSEFLLQFCSSCFFRCERGSGKPLCFYLTSIPCLSDRYSIGLPELFALPFQAVGVSISIRKVVLINYMFDLQWLISTIPILQAVPQVHVVHGERSAICRFL